MVRRAIRRNSYMMVTHLGEVRCPVRLVVGGAPHDGDVTAAEVQLLRRTVRAFALDSVPGAGHFVFEEQPEAVVAAVDRLQASLAPTFRP